MRNLKRVLSLALSAVMLLGLMVMGTGAANVSIFDDADQISHVEAASLLTGLGVFTGNGEGNFDPEGIVTRAQMAAIICKIKLGADVNAEIYAGTGKYKDASGRNAWAEGWVNLCDTLGIVNGYGDGTYGVEDQVSAWQAALMLERALGYYLPGDPSQGDELNAIKKGQEIGLFGDLNVRSNDLLTRDQVAEMVSNALFAQQVSWETNRNNYVKDSDHAVVVVPGTEDPENTLARNVFKLYMVEGIVTANGMTSPNLVASKNDLPMTRVQFSELIDVDRDGRYPSLDYDFEYGTGLDFIGHAVKVYYSVSNRNVITHAIVDDAVLVAEIANGTSAAIAAAANSAGFKRNTVMDVINADKTIANYDMEKTLTSASIVKDNAESTNPANHDKLIVISNSANRQVDYVIRVQQYLDTVATVDTDNNGVRYYVLTDAGSNGTNADKDEYTLATARLEKGDYVLATKIGDDTEVVVVEPATVVNADITRLVANSLASGRVLKTVTASGTDYTLSPVDNNLKSDTITLFGAITSSGAQTLILDSDGLLIGLAATPSTKTNYAYVAQFGVKHIDRSDSLNTDIALTALVYYADGTSKVETVDTSVTRVSGKFDPAANTSYAILCTLAGDDIGKTTEKLDEGDIYNGLDGNREKLNYDRYVYNTTTDVYEENATNADGAIGIYSISKNSNGTVKLLDIATMDMDEGTFKPVDNLVNVRTNENQAFNSVKITQKHALQMNDKNGVIYTKRPGSTVSGGYGINQGSGEVYMPGTEAGDVGHTGGVKRGYNRTYANGQTVFFYVNGSYKDKNLVVTPVVGINSATSFTRWDPSKDITVPEVWVNTKNPGKTGATSSDQMNEVVAMLAKGVYSDSGRVVYYNRDQYEVKKVEDGNWAILFYVHDAEGKAETVTYDGYGSMSAADKVGRNVLSGFYTVGEKSLNALHGKATLSADHDATNFPTTTATRDEIQVGNVVYGIEAEMHYSEYNYNNFYATYTCDVNHSKGAKDPGSDVAYNGTSKDHSSSSVTLTNFGLIFDETSDIQVIDLTGNNINTIAKLRNVTDEKKGNTVWTSYSYDSGFASIVIYVTRYNAAGVSGSETGNKGLSVISGVKKMTLKDAETWNGAKMLTVPGEAYIFSATSDHDTLAATMNIDPAKKNLCDVIYFRFTANIADYGTTAVLRIVDKNGDIVYTESGAVAANTDYMFNVQVLKTAGKSAQFTNPTATAAGSAAGADGVAQALSAGTYTWTITQGKLELAHGEFTIG